MLMEEVFFFLLKFVYIIHEICVVQELKITIIIYILYYYKNLYMYVYYCYFFNNNNKGRSVGDVLLNFFFIKWVLCNLYFRFELYFLLKISVRPY